MKNILLLLGMSALLSACVSPHKIPPLESSHEPNAFVWHDLVSNEPETSKHFYGNLFGWSFEKQDKNYSIIYDEAHKRLGGLIDNTVDSPQQQNALWLCVIQVEDILLATDHILVNGGAMIKQPVEIPDRGIVAVFADENGAILQMVQPSKTDKVNESPLWVWHELISQSPERSAKWYTKVFGLEMEKAETDDRYFLKKGDTLIASISKNPFEDTRDQWIPVLSVQDFDSIVKKAVAKGGKIIPLPSPKTSPKKLALMLDPNNAPLVLQDKGAAQ
ncbi:VOC family protein [Kiritimatiellota bacterium B12222]|nr:VOC family protein [Kiritimatiellota bacterium B12222]